MKAPSHRWAGAVLGVGAALAAFCAPAQDLTVSRSGRQLARTQATLLAPASGAPATALQPQGTAGALASTPAATRLQAVPGPQTVLRQGEVPPHRLEQTRVLLAALGARATPQQAIAFDLSADVLFDFDQARLRPDAAPAIAQAAQLIRSYPQAPVTVVGHTDARGSDAYNDALSLRRAQAVAQALEQQAGRQAEARGRGRREPVAPNTTPEGHDDPQGRQLNRRVQVLLHRPGQHS